MEIAIIGADVHHPVRDGRGKQDPTAGLELPLLLPALDVDRVEIAGITTDEDHPIRDGQGPALADGRELPFLLPAPGVQGVEAIIGADTDHPIRDGRLGPDRTAEIVPATPPAIHLELPLLLPAQGVDRVETAVSAAHVDHAVGDSRGQDQHALTPCAHLELPYLLATLGVDRVEMAVEAAAIDRPIRDGCWGGNTADHAARLELPHEFALCGRIRDVANRVHGPAAEEDGASGEHSEGAAAEAWPAARGARLERGCDDRAAQALAFVGVGLWHPRCRIGSAQAFENVSCH